MRRIYRGTTLLTVLVCWFALGLSHAADTSDKVKVQGLITGRTAETLTVKTAEGNTTVVITDDTKVQKPKGLGLRKTQMSFTALIPGLRISVDGVPNGQGQVVARTITFGGDDLQAAEAIQAGLTPTQEAVQNNQQNIEKNKVQIASNQEKIGVNQEKIAANEQEIEDVSKRFADLTEFDTKGEAAVYFKSGSTAISAKDKTALTDLAHASVNLTGYIIQVKGFADSSGNAAMNQKLSMDRAQAVIAYLIQDCNVPVRRIVAPGAMGIAAPASPNETAKGRAENRRVEVKVLVNRGLAAAGQ